MLIERVWAANDYRNFHYLVACPESGEALAIDPLDWRRCLAAARTRGYEITQILNTHEHRDHTGGNEPLRAATGARVLAHAGAAARIGHVDVGLTRGDVVRVGRTVELECLDTPGHTLAHLCLYARGDSPVLFSGDTLFNAGAGNCQHGGHPELLYETFTQQLARLPDTTRVYPGHEYLGRNLAFTLDREPGNEAAATLQQAIARQDPASAPVTTLGEEKRINTFFRLRNPVIIARLREAFPDLADEPSPREVFLRLRELRNRW
ncbi:MAG: Hydroxyacylglutathione hydrolase GloB [Steroidobacteraceae bacterium]|nr:Hydroxyacylglutathione hydrolase GloB [Steroidobacteraceae bacterium]